MSIEEAFVNTSETKVHQDEIKPLVCAKCNQDIYMSNWGSDEEPCVFHSGGDVSEYMPEQYSSTARNDKQQLEYDKQMEKVKEKYTNTTVLQIHAGFGSKFDSEFGNIVAFVEPNKTCVKNGDHLCDDCIELGFKEQWISEGPEYTNENPRLYIAYENTRFRT